MGRLTLNILLSFGQFEREVIGERIRDKVAASKARGMWMGGKVPLGYDVRDRKLVVNEAEAARVRRVFELFAETGSGVETVRRLRDEGVAAKSGRPLNRGDVYKLLNNRTYVGEVAHKGKVYPGEHEAIVPRELWDRAHAVLQESPRARANQNRAQTPALLKGLIFGVDGRALSPTHCRRRGRLYRYYVAQRVLKGDAAGDDGIVRRVSAAEIEAAVVGQVRALLRQPEVVVGTWLAARAEAPDLTEAETREALERLDPLWDELFPAEQARIVRLLVERVEVGPAGADIRLRVAGLAEPRPRPGRGCARRDASGGMSDGGQHHGPGAADDPAAAGAEDGGDAGAGRRRGGPPDARRSGAGEGAGAGVPVPAAAGRGALRLDQRDGRGGADRAGLPRQPPAADAARAGHRRGDPGRAAAGGHGAAPANGAGARQTGQGNGGRCRGPASPAVDTRELVLPLDGRRRPLVLLDGPRS